MLMVLGASHHDLELSELDRLAEAGRLLLPALAELGAQEESSVEGAVVLSTCNRIEIYLDARRFHDAVDDVTRLVGRLAGFADAKAAGLLKVRVGAPVTAHLFGVASGLDSMVVGEAEISGQVSKALSAARAVGLATPVLNSLFQGAARTAKQVATRTPLGRAGRSVASVALDLATVESADDAAGDVRDIAAEFRSALIIGTGAYARVVATALRARGCVQLAVHSPSGRAESFAATHHATSVGAADLVEAIAEVDLVVACSGHHGHALTVEVIAKAQALRGRPIRIVDLALHSDVGPGVRELPDVRVIDLLSVADSGSSGHGAAIIAAQDIVIAAVAKFEEDQAGRTLDPAVVALRRHISGAVDKEMSRLRAKYSSDIADEVELALHRVTQSLLHTPTLRARELARTGDAAGYLQALHTLFGIEITAETDRT